MNEIEYLKKYLSKDASIEEAIKRLEQGEPVQYIVGDVNFYGNTIKVNKNVLIPRRETEELVEKTYEYLKKKFTKDISILDIGTGSGCIPITLKKLLPKSKIVAVDISNSALKVAQENAKINKTDIKFIESDLFSNIHEKYDCIISNPPYIREDETIMDIVKNNEPALALYAKENGLYYYKRILRKAKQYLHKRSLIAFEIGEEQGHDIIKIAKHYFPHAQIVLEKDLQHLDRFIFIICE